MHQCKTHIIVRSIIKFVVEKYKKCSKEKIDKVGQSNELNYAELLDKITARLNFKTKRMPPRTKPCFSADNLKAVQCLASPHLQAVRYMWPIERKRSVVKCRQQGAIFTQRCHVYSLAFFNVYLTQAIVHTLTRTHIIFFTQHQFQTAHQTHARSMFVMCLSVTISFETLQRSLIKKHPANR